jgi:predicted Zn-dependent protease
MTTSLGEEISFGYTPQEKYKIGRNVGANILGTYNLYYNETLYTYLNSICNTIIINSDKVNPYKGYSIGVLDTNIINAFATPGGHILITRGMLKSVNSEDELAAVISHELSHIQLEHSIKAIKKNERTQTAGLITTGVLAILVGTQENAKQEDIDSLIDMGVNLTNFTTNLVNTGYSKKTEFKADKNAVLLMQNTGYNPNAMKSMLQTLKNNKSKNYKLGFGKTHPSPNQRLRKIKKVLPKENFDYNEEARLERFKKAKQYF